jgi:hypothetical protein
MLVPWAVYVLVTVVGPLAAGAGRRDGFGEHALIAAGLPGVATLLWVLSRHVCARVRTQRSADRGSVTDKVRRTRSPSP